MSIARGILKGFIGQAVDTKVAEDKRLADLTDRISETYLNTTLPNFLEKENEIKNRFNTIKAKDETLAKFGLAKGLYETKAGYETLLKADQSFIDKLKSANINFGDYDYSSGAITRSMNFNERNKKTQDSLINNQFGKNTVDFMIKAPVPEGAQPSTFDTSTVPSMAELGLLKSTTSNLFSSMPQKDRIDFISQGRLLFDELEKNDVTKMFRKNYEAGYDEKIHGPSKQAYAYNKFLKQFYGPSVNIVYDQDVFGAKKDMSTQMTGMGTGKTNISADVPAVDTSNTFNFQGRNYFIPDRFKGQSLTEDIKKSIASQQNNTPITQNDQRVILAQNSINIARAQGDDEAVEAIKNQLRKDLGVSNLSELIK